MIRALAYCKLSKEKIALSISDVSYIVLQPIQHVSFYSDVKHQMKRDDEYDRRWGTVLC